ncbi:lipopolysaccharide biosynthesis protein, partial [Vibrio sp. 10N.222.55.C6]
MSLLKSGGLYLIGEVLSKLIPFVLLPYFSNTLSVDEFGRLGLYQAYYNFFVIFILFGFDSIILRSYHRYGEKISNELLTLSFFYTSCV